MITWNDTFEIIKIMFNIDQKTIAYLMDVPDYKISRIKTGNLTPSFSNEDIYRKIFDPNTKDSPAKDTEKYLLSTLEDIIKNGFDNVKEAMKDYWVEDDKYQNGDYKTFVMKMLERTLYIPSPKEKSVSSDIKREAGLNNDKIEDPFSNNEATDTLSQPALPNITNETVSNIDVISDQQAKISNSDKVEETSLHTKAPVILDETVSSDINNEQKPLAPDVADEMSDDDIHENTSPTGGNVYQENPLPERMLDVFNQSYFDFAVDGFIDSNPTTDRIYDMTYFIGHIREQEKKDCLDKNNEIYQSIIDFVDILQEYLSFLKRSSGDLDFFPDNYMPPNSDDKEFSKELNRYREQLKSLYLPIKVEVEKQREEKEEQRRAAGKEAWDKSTRKCSL